MLPGAIRDESAFYQAETQNLTRENQLLKQRIRELGESTVSVRGSHVYPLTKLAERQIADMNPTSQITHSPSISSGLAPSLHHVNSDSFGTGDDPAAPAT